MRAMVAAVTAGLAGLLVVQQASDVPSSGRGPSGRVSARRPRPRADRADGGLPDAGRAASGASGARAGLDAGPSLPVPGKTRDRGPRFLGDPPGKLRLSSPDPAADAAAGAVNRAQVEKLGQQVSDLRERTAALEAQVVRSQAQAAQLQRLNEQMAELRAQLASESQRRAQAEEDQVAQRQQVQGAISGLVSAQQALAGGSSDVGEALNQAEATFSGDARREVAAARQALQNRDLAAARYYLGAAVAHAQQQSR